MTWHRFTLLRMFCRFAWLSCRAVWWMALGDLHLVSDERLSRAWDRLAEASDGVWTDGAALGLPLFPPVADRALVRRTHALEASLMAIFKAEARAGILIEAMHAIEAEQLGASGAVYSARIKAIVRIALEQLP
jgi:hypothetical protein